MRHIIFTTKKISFFIIALTLILFANFSYAQWSNPTATPPLNNAQVPLNSSSTYQIKTGDLGVASMYVASTTYSDRYCDFSGNNCFAPTGTGPGTTATTPGTGGSGFDNGEWMLVSRPNNTWIKNDTGRAIVVHVRNTNIGSNAQPPNLTVRKNASSPGIPMPGPNGKYDAVTAIVPPNHEYSQVASTIPFIVKDNTFVWHELRPVIAQSECVVEFDYKARTNTGTVTRTITRPTAGGNAGIGMWQHHDNDQIFSMTETLGFQSWGGSLFDSAERIHVGYISYTDVQGSGGALQARENEAGNNFEYEEFPLSVGATASFVTGAVKDIPAATGSVTATVLSCVDL